MNQALSLLVLLFRAGRYLTKQRYRALFITIITILDIKILDNLLGQNILAGVDNC